MADRIADDADLVVDEMKRKARRRLVGAIVLALAAAIILPMLLEKEPRPLGDDVSVQIPPVDEGKFINRLTGKSGDAKPLPKAGDKADAKALQGDAAAKPDAAALPAPPARDAAAPPGDVLVAKKSVAEAEQRALSPPSKAPAKADAKPSPAAEAKAPAQPAAEEAKAEARTAAETRSEPKPAAAAESKSAPVASTPVASSAAAAAVPARTSEFAVQLAAFADDKGANALANKLKKTGYAAYVEPVQTSRGTLWRVRVGGYASRPEADAARVKLKDEGYSGIVAPAK